MKRAKITGPVAAVLCTFIVSAAAVLVFVPPETAAYLLGGEGLIAVAVAAYLRSPRDVSVGE